MLLIQAIDDVVSDRFPVTYEEAVHLAALRAHVTLGEYSDSINMTDYMSVKDFDHAKFDNLISDQPSSDTSQSISGRGPVQRT